MHALIHSQGGALMEGSLYIQPIPSGEFPLCNDCNSNLNVLRKRVVKVLKLMKQEKS
jgi:hypothetical protein